MLKNKTMSSEEAAIEGIKPQASDPYLEIGPRRISSDGIGMTGSMAALAAGVREVTLTPSPFNAQPLFFDIVACFIGIQLLTQRTACAHIQLPWTFADLSPQKRQGGNSDFKCVGEWERKIYGGVI